MIRIQKAAEKIYETVLKRHYKIKITDKQEAEFQKAKKCYLCENELGDDRVRDHCHLSGGYRGACHNECNLMLKKCKVIPVLFHNLEGYDSHLFLKWLGYTKSKISCIAKTDEKFISFSKKWVVDSYTEKDGKVHDISIELRFLDSLKFASGNLNSLVSRLGPDQFKVLEDQGKKDGYTEFQINLLKHKGSFPYELMTSLDTLNLTKLPEQCDFYSSLTGQGISNEEYAMAKTVWKEFRCESMRDYHDLYLKTDVLLLADVMESYRELCLLNYKLDPLHYYTFPGLAMDACLKFTKVELDLIWDPDMFHMIEDGLRGGFSSIVKRYSEANHKYMSNYDPSKPSKIIIYLDVNNLYGVPMSGKLPIRNFRWMTKDELNHWKTMPCILDVDIDYPDSLHNLHNEFPVCVERRKINKVEKLVGTLYDKKNFITHHVNLKQDLELGLKLVKVHRGITFEEKAWMAPYIEMNTNLRTESTSDFEKDFFKLANNAVFGKTMENVRNHRDVRIVRDDIQLSKLTEKPNFDRVQIYSEDLMLVHMKRVEVKMYKPIFLGMTILDVSKTTVIDFHYNFIKKLFGEHAKLLFTDTDSLCYEINDVDYYEKILPYINEHFDTSNFKVDHPSGIKKGINKKVIGKMKDECGGGNIIIFVGIRPKNYSIRMEDRTEQKRCKGVKKGVVKNEISVNDYINCLRTGKKEYRKQNVIRSRGHQLFTETQNKVALSREDDKRIILGNGVDTMALGHYGFRG